MWGPDKLWRWYQRAHSPGQLRRQERWVEAIRVDLRAAFLHTAPWLQTGHREQLINVYLAAFGRGPRPVWMLDRAEQTAMALTCFGGAVVAAALMALLDSGVVGTLEASLGQQLLLLTSVVSVAALLSHPRAAVKAARRMTHPVFEQPSRPTRRFDSGVVALVLAIGFTLVGLPGRSSSCGQPVASGGRAGSFSCQLRRAWAV